jgi:hypothetical protein
MRKTKVLRYAILAKDTSTKSPERLTIVFQVIENLEFLGLHKYLI